MHIPIRSIFGALVLVLFLQAARGGAEEFRSAEGHFKFQIPKNWVRLDAAKRADVKGGMAANAIFHEGFEPPGPELGTVIVVVQDREKMSGLVTHELIEEALQKDLANQANMKVSKVALDRVKNRFTADFDTNQGGANVKGRIYGFLGKEGSVLIMAMAQERLFANHRQTFDTMADSFQFDPGFEFVPMDSAVLGGMVIGVVASVCCGLLLVAGLIGLVLYLVMRKQ